MIYFMQPVGGGPVKIGHTANLVARRKFLESHYGSPLVILATREGGRDEEQAIHSELAHLRLKGSGRAGFHPELFRPTAELMEYIGAPITLNPDLGEIAPAPVEMKVLSIKMTRDFRDWLVAVAESEGMTVIEFLEAALIEEARRLKHPTPAPKRTVR